MIKGFDKEMLFGDKVKKRKCWMCKKMVTWETGYYGYNEVFCKKHYKEFSKQAREEVDRAFKDVF